MSDDRTGINLIIGGIVIALIGILGMPGFPMSVFSVVDISTEGMPLMSVGLLIIGGLMIAAGTKIHIGR